MAFNWANVTVSGAGVTSLNYSSGGNTINNGDFLIIFMALNQAADNNPATPTPAGWTALVSTPLWDGVHAAIGWGVWYKIAGPAESGSYPSGTFSQAVTVWYAMLNYGGINVSTPIDASSGAMAGSSSTNMVAPSISPAGASDILLCFASAQGQQGPFTDFAGITNRVDNGQSASGSGQLIVSEKILTASGPTGTFTATCGGAFYFSASIALLTITPVSTLLNAQIWM